METGLAISEGSTNGAPSAIIGVEAKSRVMTIFVICFISTLFGGVVSMLMSVYLPAVVKDLLGNVSVEKMNDVSALINCLFIFGWMFGGIIWGFICDRIGRARAVWLSTGFYGLFTVITALSSSWFLVSISRFMSGFGIGGVLVTTTILISEIWPEKKRAVALGILSVAIPVGFFAAGAISHFLPGWRPAFLLGFVPLLLALVSIFILQESSAWKGNRQSATPHEEFDRKLFAPAYRPALISGSIIFGAMLIGLWAIFSWAPTWAQSLSAASEAQDRSGTTMMILASGGLTGSFFSGWIANAIGLRKTMLMCFGVCFLMTFILFKLNTSITIVTYVEMTVLAFFFGISQGALAVYIPQIFPTAVRASATGFCFNVGRLFTGTVVFFIGALVTLLHGFGNAIFIFSFIFLAGFAATWFTEDKPPSLK